MHSPRLTLPVTIAAPGGLRYGIQPGKGANHRPEVDVDAGLDQLRTDAYHRSTVQTLFNLSQELQSVSRAHAGAQMIERKIARGRPARSEDRERFALCV